jgi:ADP-ribosylglycohydrolase
MTAADDSLAPDRFVGCLLGGALGDALGYPIEFVASAGEIEEQYGAAAPRDLSYAGEAVVSDDTQMTLFSAEALVRARGAAADAAALFALGAYQRWYLTQEMSPAAARPRGGQGLLLGDARLYARRAPGNTCLGALALSFTRPARPSVDDPPNFSKGCGAVMRAAPFGLAAQTRPEAFTTARDAAVLTHGHPSGYLSAAYLAALVYDLIRGVSLADAMRGADLLLSRERGSDEVAAALVGAREAAARGPCFADTLEALGGGWVGEEALAIAVACALTATPRNVAETLWRAVAHAGDSDSTGSMAGNLVGAMFGAQALPARWRQQVELGDLVERVALDLHAVATGGRAPDPADYPAGDGVFRADAVGKRR